MYFKFPEPMDRRKSSGIRRRGFLQSFPPKKKGALRLLKPNELETLRQMARGLAAQFGSNCEVVVHEISERSTSHSVVAIENGHVSGRKLGDGPSQVVLEQLGKDGRAPEDQLCYLTRTPDGKLLNRRPSTSATNPGACAPFSASTLIFPRWPWPSRRSPG